MYAPAAGMIEPAEWLEVIEGVGPILLIAPHGGRAGAASRSTLHPKVNDLETAAITRDLAQRLGATALINAGMDRNEIDCNRLSQLGGRAPWMLDLIAQCAQQMIERHGHATVLLIHGWNVIEPRIDFGLGLREANGRLRPPADAHVSASDGFINGPVAALSARLGAAGITPTFGLRYPGGASQNLLQAFTQRHAASEIEALRQLAGLAARGAIDALVSNTKPNLVAHRAKELAHGLHVDLRSLEHDTALMAYLLDPGEVQQPRRTQFHLVDHRALAARCTLRELHELAMQAQVAGKLRMEAQSDDASLADCNGVTAMPGDHLGGSRRFDKRRPDEDTRK